MYTTHSPPRLCDSLPVFCHCVVAITTSAERDRAAGERDSLQKERDAIRAQQRGEVSLQTMALDHTLL